jgi:mono/diheme cytochrome c family protein
MLKTQVRAHTLSIATALITLALQASCDAMRPAPLPTSSDDDSGDDENDDDDQAAEKRDAGRDAGTTRDAGTSGIDAGKDAGKKDSGSARASLYCKAQAVLDAHCVRCHDGEGTEGAPMALKSFDDLMANTPSNPRDNVYEAVAVRVNDRDAPMPPAGLLRTTQLKDLEAWLEADAPNDAENGCD